MFNVYVFETASPASSMTEKCVVCVDSFGASCRACLLRGGVAFIGSTFFMRDAT